MYGRFITKLWQRFFPQVTGETARLHLVRPDAQEEL